MTIVRGAQSGVYTVLGQIDTLPAVYQWYYFPVMSNLVDAVPDFADDVDEIQALGARSELPIRVNRGIGSITMRPCWDDYGMHMLLGLALGGKEYRVLGKNFLNAADAGCNAHWFDPGWDDDHPGISLQKAIHITTAGSIHYINNMRVNRLIMEYTPKQYPKYTFEMVAQAADTLLPYNSSFTPSTIPTARVGTHVSVPQDDWTIKYRTPGGNTWVAANQDQTRVTITVDNRIEPVPWDLADNRNGLSPVGNRIVTVEVEGMQQTAWDKDVDAPFPQFVRDEETGVDIYHQVDLGVGAFGGATGYGLRIRMPKVKWSEARTDVDSPGVISYTAIGQALIGSDYAAGDFGNPSAGIDIQLASNWTSTDESNFDLTNFLTNLTQQTI